MTPVHANTRHTPQTGGTGRPPFDSSSRYGGGGGNDESHLPSFHERLRRYRFGITIALISIVTLFAMLAAAYLFRQTFQSYDPSTGMFVRHWQPIPIPVRLLWLNTLLLALSSLTLELARRQTIRRAALAPALHILGIADDARAFPWLGLTVMLGSLFLTGQIAAWSQIRAAINAPSGTSDSFFYILTGAHALHLLAGLLALLYALALSFGPRHSDQLRLVVDVTSWYWHVIGALWLCLFALFLLAP